MHASCACFTRIHLFIRFRFTSEEFQNAFDPLLLLPFNIPLPSQLTPRDHQERGTVLILGKLFFLFVLLFFICSNYID